MTGERLDGSEPTYDLSGSSLDCLSAGESSILEALLVGIFDCAAVIDASRRYIYVNQEYVDFVSKPASEIIGKTILEVLGNVLDDSYRMIIATLPPGGSIDREEWIDYGALGRRYIKQTITGCPRGSGVFAGHLILSRDLTDFKVQQLELERRIEAQAQADAYHAAIVKNALDAIVVIDETGAVVDFNPAAVSIFGYSRDEAVGRQIGDLIIPEALRTAHDRGLSNYLQSGKSNILGRRLELEAQCANGEQIPIELTITEVRLGTRRLFAAHLRDLAAVRQAQEEIERQREGLHQKDKLTALGSLLAAVAHELNNPLSIVIGQTMMLRETLASTPMAADLVQRSAKIEIAAHRCASIVRSFLDMARQRKHERRRVLISDIVEAALELLSYNLRSSGVEVDIDVPKDLPALWIDADQIHQVIVNLVVNAYQSLEEKTEGRRLIRISAEQDARAKTISLKILDNGAGIPPNIRSRIFDPYFTTKPQGSGTGIGLAVSRGLIESHGGTLDVDLTPSLAGAGFIIVLPIDDTGATPDTEDRPEAAFQGATTGQHVLVIDDEIEIANLLADMVGKLGFSASVAIGGDAAKAFVERGSQSVHAILCDIRMPGGDGPSFFGWLSQNHPHLIECTGFITGDTLGPAAGRFLARSGCPVIQKPFVFDDIRRILKALVKTIALT